MIDQFISLVFSIMRLLFILIPLRIAIEFLDEYGIIDIIAGKLKVLTSWYEISAKTLVPLLTGMILGVYLGGPMLVDFHSNKKIMQHEADKVMNVWTFAHGLIDETAVFTIIGASMIWILGIRIMFAFLAVKLLLILSKKKIFQTMEV